MIDTCKVANCKTISYLKIVSAGDYVKFGFPMAAMTTQLAWGAISFQMGYEAANQMKYIKECLQWATDYFIAAHTAEDKFYGQIGEGQADHSYWGRPEDMTMNRPAWFINSSAPGSELAGETAAALAAASIFYKNIGEDSLARDALRHARELFDLANNFRGKYTNTIPNAQSFYEYNRQVSTISIHSFVNSFSFQLLEWILRRACMGCGLARKGHGGGQLLQHCRQPL